MTQDRRHVAAVDVASCTLRQLTRVNDRNFLVYFHNKSDPINLVDFHLFFDENWLKCLTIHGLRASFCPLGLDTRISAPATMTFEWRGPIRIDFLFPPLDGGASKAIWNGRQRTGAKSIIQTYWRLHVITISSHCTCHSRHFGSQPLNKVHSLRFTQRRNSFRPI